LAIALAYASDKRCDRAHHVIRHGYLIDTGAQSKPYQSLQLDWRQKSESFAINVRLDASDDLKNWEAINTRAPLMRLDYEGERLEQRLLTCWSIMERGVASYAPAPYILGDDLTVLDLYVTVVSRFRPRRQRFYAVAPRLGEIVRRVDADPRLTALWAARYPMVGAWDR